MSEHVQPFRQPPTPYVVHGSFRKHLAEVQSAITTLDATGFATAIAPHNCMAVDERDGFVMLAGEEEADPRALEAAYLQKVLSLRALGGFSLWINPDGYVGKSAAYEYGIAQACGVPAYFAEQPTDVPFYVDPARVRRPDQLAEDILHGQGALPTTHPDADPLASIWNRLPFPTAMVAVGGLVRHRDQLLLVEDGRWQDGQLTIPGTTVRASETRDEALHRALHTKFGLDIAAVTGLEVSFMLKGSGYAKPVHDLVFDDRAITAASDRLRPHSNLTCHWASVDEVSALLLAGQIEPNAAALIANHTSVA